VRAYLDLTNPPARLAPWGIFVLQIVWSFAFFMHGYQKLFMLGVAGVSSFFTQIGVPLPGLAAPAVSVLELVGGLLLLVGLGTRWVSVLFCCGPGALALDRALFNARPAEPSAAWSGEDRRERSAPPA
jgi:hypothetical protein